MNSAAKPRSYLPFFALGAAGALLWNANQVSSQDAHIVEAVESAANQAGIYKGKNAVLASLLAKPVNPASPADALQRLLHMASVFPVPSDGQPHTMSLEQVCRFWKGINQEKAFQESAEWQAFRTVYDPLVNELLGSGANCGKGIIRGIRITERLQSLSIPQLDGSVVQLPAKSRHVELDVSKSHMDFDIVQPPRKTSLSAVNGKVGFYVNNDVGYALKSRADYLNPPVKNPASVKIPFLPGVKLPVQSDAARFAPMSVKDREALRGRMQGWQDTVAKNGTRSRAAAADYLRLQDRLGREDGTQILRDANSVTSAFNLFMARGEGELKIKEKGDPMAGIFGGLSILQTDQNRVVSIGKGFLNVLGQDLRFFRGLGGSDGSPLPTAPSKSK